MSLWHIYSQENLTGMYEPADPEMIALAPKSTWPSWFKGTYGWHLDPYWAKVFFYIPSEDLFCLWAMMNTYPNFIGIYYPYGLWAALTKHVRIFFKGESGEVFDYNTVHPDRPTFPDMSAWGFRGGSIGSYERLYVTSTAWGNPCAYEIYWQDLASAGWQVCGNADTVPVSPYGGWGAFPIVNREDGYLAWGEGTALNLFKLNSIDGLWHRFGIAKTLGTMNYCCYENRENCWWITTPEHGSKVGKLNYQKNRHEILTSAQAQYDDVQKNMIAFDTRRKRLAVLRARPDDPVTGACKWALDFYRPIVKVSALGLTDPVPVTEPRAGNRLVFVANLIGEVGEALAPHTVQAEMEVPVEGKLLTPLVTSDQQGKLYTLYQALAAGEEKMTLTTEVKDGDPATQEW